MLPSNVPSEQLWKSSTSGPDQGHTETTITATITHQATPAKVPSDRMGCGSKNIMLKVHAPCTRTFKGL
eukprot:1159783-Pelagomonas_calceolata.AAC.8